MVAEELAERFLVIGDAMFVDESEKIVGSETGEGGFCEMRIGGDEIFGSGVKVGEVAAASAGNEDFFADAVGVFEERDATAASAGLEGAEETGGTSAEDQDVEGRRHEVIVGQNQGGMKGMMPDWSVQETARALD